MDTAAEQAVHRFEELVAHGKDPTIRYNEFEDYYSVLDEDDLPFHEM